MLAQRRYEVILEMLRAEGPVAVGTIAERLEVSEATVRRDLSRLQQEDLLTRVRGGAAAARSRERSFAEVAREPHPSRDEVAGRAAELVQDGDVLLLDIGTTIHQLARHLHGRTVTVMTSNLAVYEELMPDPDIELILLGGVVRRNYRSLVGFLTEDCVRQVRAGRLFMGTSGVLADGTVVDTTAVEIPGRRAMINASDQVVLVADETKFPGTGYATVCGPEELDVVVTTDRADGPTLTTLRDAGIEVITG
jgi:DeoR/GlpR family transcriptional regulator of sugar metabolism